MLSGRKVDAEKGCVLKAEMAKKNLHTKRGLSNSSSSSNNNINADLAPNSNFNNLPLGTGISSSSGGGYSLGGGLPSAPPGLTPSFPVSPTESTPWPANSNSFAISTSNSLVAVESKETLNVQNQPHQGYTSPVSGARPGSATGNFASFDFENYKSPVETVRSYSISELPMSVRAMQPHQSIGPASPSSVNPVSVVARSITDANNNFSSSSNTGGYLQNSGQQQHSPQQSQLHQQTSQSANLARSGSIPPASMSGVDRNFLAFKPQHRSMSEAVVNGGQSLTINTSSFSSQNATSNSAQPLQNGGNSMPAPPLLARNTIPADQNPPCNTLYVGNLPPNAQEEELRRLFSRARGYKRLCFKPKPGTGPMCFVEFEDIYCATKALNELYGSVLSNSVKGGIRLSYSKNPLGVRQNPNNSNQFSTQQQSTQQQSPSQLKVITDFPPRSASVSGPFSAGATQSMENIFTSRSQSISISGPFSASTENPNPGLRHNMLSSFSTGGVGKAHDLTNNSSFSNNRPLFGEYSNPRSSNTSNIGNPPNSAPFASFGSAIGKTPSQVTDSASSSTLLQALRGGTSVIDHSSNGGAGIVGSKNSTEASTETTTSTTTAAANGKKDGASTDDPPSMRWFMEAMMKT